MRKVILIAKPQEKIDVVDCNTNEVIERTDWKKYLSNKEWSQCRDGLLIYKRI